MRSLYPIMVLSRYIGLWNPRSSKWDTPDSSAADLLLTGRAAIGEIPVRTSGKDQIDPKPQAALGSMPLLVPADGAAEGAAPRQSCVYVT